MFHQLLGYLMDFLVQWSMIVNLHLVFLKKTEVKYSFEELISKLHFFFLQHNSCHYENATLYLVNITSIINFAFLKCSFLNAERIVVTQGTPQWYPGNLNPICTLVMQDGSLSPRVLPNGTQAISILCRFVYFYDGPGTIRWQQTPTSSIFGISSKKDKPRTNIHRSIFHDSKSTEFVDRVYFHIFPYQEDKNLTLIKNTSNELIRKAQWPFKLKMDAQENQNSYRKIKISSKFWNF